MATLLVSLVVFCDLVLAETTLSKSNLGHGLQSFLADQNVNLAAIGMSVITDFDTPAGLLHQSPLFSTQKFCHQDVTMSHFTISLQRIIVTHEETFKLVIMECGEIPALQPYLQEISRFYDNNPQQVGTVIFLIFWPISGCNDHFVARDYVEKNLQNANLRSCVYIWIRNGCEDRSSWWEFYTLGNITVFRPIQTRYSTSRFLSLVQRRRDFQRTLVRALVKEELPNWPGGAAIEVEMLRVLSWRLNFTLELVEGKAWIGQHPNGKLTGMAEQLEERDGDLIMASSELLPYRRAKLGISQPVIVLPLHAYYRKPHPSEYQNTLAEAFRPTLWLAFVANGAIVYIVILVLSAIRRYYHQPLSPADTEVVKRGNALLWTIGAYCQQGWHTAPTSASFKVVAVVTLASGLLYYTAYSASIVSIYSVERNRFRTIDEIVSHGFTLYGTTHSYQGYGHVQSQAEKEGVPARSRLIKYPEAMTMINSTRSTWLTTHAIFRASTRSLNYTEDDICPWISETPLPQNLHLMCMYYRKNDPMIKFVDLELARWRETGLLYRDIHDYLAISGVPCDPTQKLPRILGCADVRAAYQVLGIGFISSLIILCGEIYTKRMQFRKSRDNTVVPVPALHFDDILESTKYCQFCKATVVVRNRCPIVLRRSRSQDIIASVWQL